MYFNVAFDRQQTEHSLHIDQSLTNLSIDGSEEVERYAKLEQKRVGHDQVANGHLA